MDPSAAPSLLHNDSVRAVILGIVEGLTEFLPVSSTGHMILVEPLLGIAEGDPFWTGTFDIFIQIGAILAVLVYFWRRLLPLVMVMPARHDGRTPSPENPSAVTSAPPSTELIAETSPNPSAATQTVVAPAAVAEAATEVQDVATNPRVVRWYEHILVKLFVAFLPAAVVGLVADDFIEAHLKTPRVVAGALVVGGILIIAIERLVRRPRYHDAAAIPLRIALFIGIAQCLALIPGTSRSAATIMGALALGLTAPAAAEFSFFLAIPTMFAAGGYSLLKHLDEIRPEQFAILGLGFSVAFVVALLVVAGFMRFIQTHRFTPFAIYRIILGAIVLAVLLK